MKALSSFGTIGCALYGLISTLQCSPAYSAPVVTTGKTKVYEGKLADLANPGPVLYSTETRSEKDGDSERVVVVRKDAEGQVEGEQVLSYVQGELTEYQAKSRKSEKSAKVAITDSEVQFEVVKDGKTKSGKISKSGTFIIGPAINRFILSRLSQLAQGEEAKFQLGVPDRMDSFSFVVKKVKGEEPEVQDGRWLKIEMKPTSFVIAVLVKSMHFYVDAKSGRMIRYVGPTEPRKPGEEAGVFGTVIYE